MKAPEIDRATHGYFNAAMTIFKPPAIYKTGGSGSNVSLVVRLY